MPSAEYRNNRQRVAEIYEGRAAFHPDRRPSGGTHHIVQRSDVKNFPELFGDFDIDDKANLVPLTKDDHTRTHQLLNEQVRQEKKQRRHRKR